jgi:REP element-mobilizing transposase RayT
MEFSPSKHSRRSVRIKGYDYSSPGAYFVTLCVNRRKCTLGRIAVNEIRLSSIGRNVKQYWEGIPDHFPQVLLDEFIVMPNHMHGIIIITDTPCRGTACRAPTTDKFGKPTRGSLSTIIRSFKSTVTKHVNKQKSKGMARRSHAENSFWQRNYYEHVVRGENDLNRIRQYILNNPFCWKDDEENPDNF